MRSQLRSNFPAFARYNPRTGVCCFSPVDFQFEPILKKRLHHQAHVFFGRLFGPGFCLNVKFIFHRPTWEAAHQSAPEFADFNLVGEDEKTDERLIRRGENSSSREIGTSTVEWDVRT